MLKKNYVRRAYIEVMVCDKCGSLMAPTGQFLTGYPLRYPYKCSNEECDFTAISNEWVGQIKYEFEEGLCDV